MYKLVVYFNNLKKTTKKNTTSIRLLITIGKIESGNLNILKSVTQTNAVRASNLLFLSIYKYVANDTNVTLNFNIFLVRYKCLFNYKLTNNGANCHINEDTAFVNADFFKILNSLSRIFDIISRNDNSHP